MSARWGDYLDKLLGSAGNQVTLQTDSVQESHVEDRETVVAQRVWNVTSENWLSLPEARDDTADETPVKWLYYFTSSNENGTRNATFWDGIFEVRFYFCIIFPCASPSAFTILDGDADAGGVGNGVCPIEG